MQTIRSSVRITTWVLVSMVALGFSAQAQVLRRAPGFSLPDLTLKQHDLQDYKGKVVLLEFMMTECPKCQEATTVLERVKAKYGDKVQVFSVVTSGVDNQSKVARYIAQHKATSTFLFDCGQMTGSYLQVSPKNPTVHFPHVLVVDKNGMIRRDLAQDTVTEQNIIATVDPLLK